jgi:hypothetical protein
MLDKAGIVTVALQAKAAQDKAIEEGKIVYLSPFAVALQAATEKVLENPKGV